MHNRLRQSVTAATLYPYLPLLARQLSRLGPALASALAGRIAAKVWPAPCKRLSTTRGVPCDAEQLCISSCRVDCRWISARNFIARQRGFPMKLRGLYAITDSQLLVGKFLAYVEAALTVASPCCSTATKAATRHGACAVESSKNRARAKTHLIINDDVELAARLGVGVHLLDRRPADLGLAFRRMIIGATCHSQIELTNRPPKKAPATSPRPLLQFHDQTGAPAATVDMLAQARKRSYPPIWCNWRRHPENAVSRWWPTADLLAVVHGSVRADSTQEVTRRACAFNDLLKSSA